MPWPFDESALSGEREESSALGTIICGVDASPGANEAVRAACELSEGLGLRLVLAHVATGPLSGAEQFLDRVVQLHGLQGRAERRAEVGTRSDLLLRIAAEEGADMIVVGASRRRGRLRCALADEISGAATCPVVVVPPAL
jgi:nucleotide-binding universal stress UspA family protein